VTKHLQLAWPDPALFATRGGRPVRILALSDEVEPSIESPTAVESLGPVDFIVGAGDLGPEYLDRVAHRFNAPLLFVRGNHDAGIAWRNVAPLLLPEPLPDGRPVTEAEIRIVGFSGSPVYTGGPMQVHGLDMWLRVLPAWLRARGRRPLLVVTHAAPRGLGDADDLPHRGFTAFRWLLDRLKPPLWLHGHTALVRRGLDERCVRHEGTLLYNCTGATLIELLPPDGAAAAA
jgi:hypothetical protein